MKTPSWIGIFAIALALIGCQDNTSASPSTSGHGQGASSPQSQPVVPESLKNDAYRYFGLSNEKPLNLKLTATGRPAMQGTQTVHLQSVEGGKALFQVERTGDLEEQLGSDTVSLEPSGVYTVKSSRLTAENLHNIELPAKLTPGATWVNTGKFEQAQGGTIEQNTTFKVVGPAKATTEAGAQDAILVTAAGTMTLSGQRFRMQSRMWYVKDKGMVKWVSTLTNLSDPKQKPSEITIQEAK